MPRPLYESQTSGGKVEVTRSPEDWCNLCPATERRNTWRVGFDSPIGQNIISLHLCGEHLNATVEAIERRSHT